ncbi:ATP-dependent DNA helicase [Butyrivibrio sp. INlla16]|uniref:ATP-dependent helicase n=1 Tax=Butyrivibrio sp. INlla16 TaxID=1520807 RepID=UPI00088CEF21|nr:ATP-dependent DNA helicase [Butyrivibrio sp. INlla16]SDB53891.1 DNA helicase-2 / ATP-dependent DNA helicase PcrA [Butyrivibrio sp. INlla16]
MGWLDGLSENQLKAINTIDEDLQIIACAGAGKTGVVTRRVVNILKQKSNIRPENIVAFTFTEKAAEELKGRIYKYGEEVLGNTQGFATMYVGTIHGFCLKMLQEYIPQFQKFTVLDEIKTKLFIEKYSDRCGMNELGLKKYTETNLFLNVMGVLNENSFDSDKWDDKAKIAVQKYREVFYEKNYFDYSLIMKEMLFQLENNREFADLIYSKVKYLTVDEYQDINPIQERLVSFIREGGCNLCVVGDDDQTIYQFRGSDPENILTFKDRYNVKNYIVLDKDYRSTEGIVGIAQKVIENNLKRLPKKMVSGSVVKYEDTDTIYSEFNSIEDECKFIADRIIELHDAGIMYSEMAVLLRKRKFGSSFAKVFEGKGIPFIVEGVNELFTTAECKAAKGIYEYLNGDITAAELRRLWMDIAYPLDVEEVSDAIQAISHIDVKGMKFYGEFVIQKVFHDFLRHLSIVSDSDNKSAEVILYNLGKFSQVINDFETVYYATLPKNKLYNFCSFMKYMAEGTYPEGYIANTYIRPDAVSIMTIHQSKGLEYTAVFIPQLNKNNFPSKKIGGKGIWHVISKDWIRNSDKIAGDDPEDRIEEERKLFYVAVTRSRKYLFLTRAPYNRAEKEISQFLIEAKRSSYMIAYDEDMKYSGGDIPRVKKELAPINLNFSILQDYFECAYRFKLSMFYGFVQPIATAMGYGKAMHEIVMNIHRKYIAGEKLTEDEVHAIVENSFYLPYANPKLEESMRQGADKSAINYYEKNMDEFKNITMAEADIELDMGEGIKVNGRIDLVKRKDISGNTKTYIVDFKTADRDVTECINTEQLKIYALGYERLTGERADFLEIYNLDNSEQERQRVTDSLMTDVVTEIKDAANNIRNDDLPRNCSREKCKGCYLNYLCLNKQEKSLYEV